MSQAANPSDDASISTSIDELSGTDDISGVVAQDVATESGEDARVGSKSVRLKGAVSLETQMAAQFPAHREPS